MIVHRTRIAPSPTGDLHLGTARTAYFCYLIARASEGAFILRIDDTDLARHSEAAVQVIDDSLAWLGLEHDLRIRQSARLPLYRMLADKMLSAGLARLDDGCIRLAPNDVPASWTDTICGSIAVGERDRETIRDLVLMRSDGMPTYHMASVVDDMALGITWVVRGADHTSNTPKHIALWRALARVEWEGAGTAEPLWSHVGLITSKGAKLSKRDGAASLLSYRDAGIDPDALLNWVLRMGWGPTVDDKTTKMIDRHRAIELFLDGGRMRASPANMDTALLAAYNRRYQGSKQQAARAEAGVTLAR